MTNTNIPREDDGTVVRFAWPGGYRVWYVTDDSEELCAECVQEHLSRCEDVTDYGWYIIGRYNESESDDSGPCAHCYRQGEQ